MNAFEQTIVFTVSTQLTYGESYDLACSFTAPVTSCRTTSFIDVLDPAHPKNVTVWYAVGRSTGTGSLKLTATPTINATPKSWGTFAITTTATYLIGVTPDTQSVQRVASANAYQTFAVHNLGTAPDMILDLSTSCSGQVSGCAVVPSSLTLSGGQTGNAEVAYTAGSAGTTGVVKLIATYQTNTAIKDSGKVTVAVPAVADYSVRVISRSTDRMSPASATDSAPFTVRNVGNQNGVVFNLSRSVSGSISASGSIPSSVTLDASQESTIYSKFTTSSAATTGQMTVVAQRNAGSEKDSGVVSITAITPPPARIFSTMNPHTGSVYHFHQSGTRQSIGDVVLTNTGDTTVSVTITPSTDNSSAMGTININQLPSGSLQTSATLSIAAGASYTYRLTGISAGGGRSTVSLVLAEGSFRDTARVIDSVSTVTPTVSAPDSAAQTLHTLGGSTITNWFDVTNGPTQATWTVTTVETNVSPILSNLQGSRTVTFAPNETRRIESNATMSDSAGMTQLCTRIDGYSQPTKTICGEVRSRPANRLISFSNLLGPNDTLTAGSTGLAQGTFTLTVGSAKITQDATYSTVHFLRVRSDDDAVFKVTGMNATNTGSTCPSQAFSGDSVLFDFRGTSTLNSYTPCLTRTFTVTGIRGTKGGKAHLIVTAGNSIDFGNRVSFSAPVVVLPPATVSVSQPTPRMQYIPIGAQSMLSFTVKTGREYTWQIDLTSPTSFRIDSLMWVEGGQKIWSNTGNTAGASASASQQFGRFEERHYRAYVSAVTSGSMTAIMIASNGAVSARDSAWITSAPAGAARVDVSMMPNDQLPRSICVTFGAGPGAAWQCGDLIVSHSTLPYLSRGEPHAMTLLYNSNTAAPRSAVVATVGFADSVAPTSVRAIVKVAVDTLSFAGAETTFFSGNSFWSGARRRIAPRLNLAGKATGRYVWQLQVTPITGGVVGSTSTFRGTTLVANHSASPVGNGWQLAGIDRVFWAGSLPSDSSVLIVEGDGSAKLFTKTSTGWQSPRGDFSRLSISGDTILRRHKNGVVQYLRPAVSGVVKVTGPTGVSARYHWSQVSSVWRVDSIIDEAGVRSRLFYTSGLLDSIRSPDISGIKVLKLSHSGSNVSAITDPDQLTTDFEYNANGLLKQRTGRGGKPIIAFEYDSSYTVRSMLGPVTYRYRSLRSNGFADGSSIGTSTSPAIAGDSTSDNFFANTRGDTTRFIVNAVGQPVKVTKPSGANTTIWRSSAHLLPDSVSSEGSLGLPDGLFMKAVYDPSSGDLLKTTSRWRSVLNTDGNWQTDSAITSYAYDSVFHQVTKITQADSGIREFFYTGAFRDSIRVAGVKMVSFEYYGRDDATQDSSYWMAAKFDGAGDTPGTFGQLKSIRERGHSAPLTYFYGQYGNLKAVETPGQRIRSKGEKTTYLYDATGVRISGVVGPAGDSTTYTYDDIRRVKVRATVGRASRPPIVAPGSTWKERLVRRDSIAYDDYNLITTFVTQSPNGARVSKVYRDALGNVTKECPYTAVGMGIPCDEYFYEHGLLSYETLRNGARHDYKYDGDGRVVEKIIGSAAQFAFQAPESRAFALDTLVFLHGQFGVVQAQSRATLVRREYRGANLFREIQSAADFSMPLGYSVRLHPMMFQYTHDKLGRVTKREMGRPEFVQCADDTYCDHTKFLIGGTDTVVSVSYHYDALGRVDSLHWGGLPRRGSLTFAQRGFDFAYDSASRWIGTSSTVQASYTNSPYVLSQSYGEDGEVNAVSWTGDSRLTVYDTVDSPVGSMS